MDDDVGCLKIRPLPPDLLEHAIKKLNEDPKRRAADVQAIREWFKKQPHIIADPSDQLIISFLRACKFSLERTKEKLDLYYTVKSALPELFGGCDFRDKKLREIADMGHFFPLPEPDEFGRSVYMMRPGINDPNIYSQAEAFKATFMMIDMGIRCDDRVIVKGLVNVGDMGQLSMAHIVQMTPSFVKKVSVCFQDAYPLRPQSQNMINTPPFFDIIYNLINSFTKEKIRKRNFVHGKDMDSLHKKVSQKLLPTEYGGSAGSVTEINGAYVKKLLEFNDWYLADAECGVDEKKRPGKPKTSQDLFGTEGSFRQLNVD